MIAGLRGHHRSAGTAQTAASPRQGQPQAATSLKVVGPADLHHAPPSAPGPPSEYRPTAEPTPSTIPLSRQHPTQSYRFSRIPRISGRSRCRRSRRTSSGSGGHRAAAFHGRAKRDGRRLRAGNAAGPPLQCIAEHGRAALQKASGYNIRAGVEATIGRFKQVIGDGLRSRTDQRRADRGGRCRPCLLHACRSAPYPQVVRIA